MKEKGQVYVSRSGRYYLCVGHNEYITKLDGLELVTRSKIMLERARDFSFKDLCAAWSVSRSVLDAFTAPYFAPSGGHYHSGSSRSRCEVGGKVAWAENTRRGLVKSVWGINGHCTLDNPDAKYRHGR